MKQVKGIDLSFDTRWDIDDELRIEVAGTTEHLTREKVEAIKNHLEHMLSLKPGSKDNDCWE